MTIVPALYLIPVGISEAPLSDALPAGNIDVVKEIRHYAVENIRTARRFLRRCSRDIDIDSLTLGELNEHTTPAQLEQMLEPLRRGEAVGVMSEAGCPGVADPGADLVALAQRKGLRVIPLVGPSSILMSLMASGFNGQGFTFNGYLPIDAHERTRKLRELESTAARSGTTQIFIETPYRNSRMLAAIAETLKPDTPVCVATAITDPVRESIITMKASAWRGRELPKEPTVFLIHKP